MDITIHTIINTQLSTLHEITIISRWTNTVLRHTCDHTNFAMLIYRCCHGNLNAFVSTLKSLDFTAQFYFNIKFYLAVLKLRDLSQLQKGKLFTT